MYVVEHGDRVEDIYQNRCSFCHCTYRFGYKDIKKSERNHYYVTCPECSRPIFCETIMDFDFYRWKKER